MERWERSFEHLIITNCLTDLDTLDVDTTGIEGFPIRTTSESLINEIRNHLCYTRPNTTISDGGTR